MLRIRNLQDLFRRYRRPGDFVFALGFFILAAALLIALPDQTVWARRTRLFAQPGFWPGVAVIGMAVFGGFHLLGSILSERIPGRRAEALYWLRAAEWPLWFLAYVQLAPWAGYLPASLLFCTALTLRIGYRGWRPLLAAAGFAVAAVLLFRAGLQVKIPAGALYEHLPDAIRVPAMTWF